MKTFDEYRGLGEGRRGLWQVGNVEEKGGVRGWLRLDLGLGFCVKKAVALPVYVMLAANSVVTI